MTILHIILALLGLGFLVFIHELGHYFVAKWTKMDVETFSIGFGPAMFRWKRGDVTWQVAWLPFGGFVKIKGMELAKKGKGEYVDPYTIEGGFFSKSPWKRIAVALAGPCANFLLALIVLTAIWALGGREKPFSESTQIIGWVDPQSKLYEEGVRAGDLLTRYDNKPYKNAKDLLYAALFNGKNVKLEGAHVDWLTNQKEPFTYQIVPYGSSKAVAGMKTTGIGTNARYLIYDAIGDSGKNEFMEGSPMAASGIRFQDRVVWADGQILFSLEQLSDLINRDYALLTVERGDRSFLTRQPRIATAHLILPDHVRGDLLDDQYAAKLRMPFSQLKILPYSIDNQGNVESPLSFVDEESQKMAFPFPQIEEEQPLQVGDRIVAIDGIPFIGQAEMLKILQHHKVHLIVQEGVKVKTGESAAEEDQIFAKEWDVGAIEKLASSIGKSPEKVEGYRILKPVEPTTYLQFQTGEQVKELLQKQLLAKRKEIEGIKDHAKREKVRHQFEQEQRKRVLGVYFQDRHVQYNPSPFVMFGSIFSETWSTLKALFSGNLNPKWLSGPVGIVQVMHHGWGLGVKEALFWVALISINLGFLNLLPLPVLDGGYICLSLWELITRKKLHPRTMERLIVPFTVLLISLLLFLTFQDVLRLF